MYCEHEHEHEVIYVYVYKYTNENVFLQQILYLLGVNKYHGYDYGYIVMSCSSNIKCNNWCDIS